MACLGGVALVAGQALNDAPTLGVVLERIGAPLDGLTEAQRGSRITSYQTAATNGEFAIAYWVANRAGTLEPPLSVALHERGRPWRVASLDTLATEDRGSITRLDLTETDLYVGVQLSPSALRTQVLRRALTRVGSFYGWWVAGIPNGPTIFVRSMVHFAPAHPEELATFDPATRREAQLCGST
jgi:hypothetical protein